MKVETATTVFDVLFLLTTLDSFEKYALNLKFVLTQFSIIYRGRQMIQKTSSHSFLPFGVESLFWVYMDCGMAIFFPCLGFVLQKDGAVSLFLPS